VTGPVSERRLAKRRGEIALVDSGTRERAVFSTQAEFAMCTIAAKNYLAHVRVLTDSFLKYHPSSSVFVLLVDEVDQHFDPSAERFHLITLNEIGIGGLKTFLFKYGILEVSTAVKPFFLDYLFRTCSLRKLVYLDPDILVTNSLTPISSLLDEHSIILTPHLLDPIHDNLRPTELDILLAGTYNLGFIALANDENTRSFLAWWKERLYDYCVMAPSRGMHVDQKWVELALGLFNGVYVLRDPGYNVAYWNVGSRKLKISSGQYSVNGKPLRFFHFSGFDPEKIEQVSKHQNRFVLRDLRDYKVLFKTYRDLLYSKGFKEDRELPWKYDYFDNGVRIPDAARKMYRESKQLQRKYANPFSTRGRDNYFSWMNSSAESGMEKPYITRLWYEVYKLRKDLQEAYPDIFGSDRGGFIGWIINTGWKEHNIDRVLVPQEYFSISGFAEKQHKPPLAALVGYLDDCRRALSGISAILRRSFEVIRHEGAKSFLRQVAVKMKKREFRIIQPRVDTEKQSFTTSSDTESGPRVSQRHRSKEPLTIAVHTEARLEFGVNMAGYFTGQFGNATSSRAFAKTLELAGIPHVLNKLVGEIHGERHKISCVFSRSNPYAINLVHVNADTAEGFFNLRGPNYSRSRYNIGIWYWELSRFPVRWLPAFRFYDEIWAASSFIAECLSRDSPIPVVKIRYPLFIDTSIIDSRARRKFGLKEDCFVFLFSFDFLSVFERKNPVALLKAFNQAFGRDDEAVLVLHHINSKVNPIGARTLERLSSKTNVRILNRHLSEGDYLSLVAASDCYVSLHRSEGLGLTIAAAMYLGKPAIATAYSGNMDFMDVNNSLLVKYDLVELGQDYGPYEKGNVWAEVDVGHAAELMRWVYENREEAKAVGQRALRDVRKHLDPTLAACETRARLQQVYERF